MSCASVVIETTRLHCSGGIATAVKRSPVKRKSPCAVDAQIVP
jgi:hypothetical protein